MNDADLLIKGSPEKPLINRSRDLAFQYFRNAIMIFILLIQINICSYIFCHIIMRKVLADTLFRKRNPQFLIHFHQTTEILPAARCHKLHAIDIIFDHIKIRRPQIKIRQQCRVNMSFDCIFFPHRKISFNPHPAHAVQCHHVKFAHRFIVLRRISCRYNDPSFRHCLIAKCLALQKLEHRRRERLRHAIDLVDKKNPFF